MEKTGNNPIKINQHDVKIMLQDRIMNPKNYIDQPLLIWRGNFDDGILRQIFFNFESHVVKEARPKWVKLKLDHINDTGIFLPAEKDFDRVFCVILSLPDQNLGTPPTYEEYSDLINTDWLKQEQERVMAPIVLFLPFIEQPDAFKGYSQYIFNPNYKEWKETLAGSNRKLIKHLVGFLDSSVSEEERIYRWYQYFQRQKDVASTSDLKCQAGGTGCDFPSCWDEGIINLLKRYIPPLAQIPKDYIPRDPIKISEISTSVFKTFFNKGISEDVIEDFRNYLMEHNAEV